MAALRSIIGSLLLKKQAVPSTVSILATVGRVHFDATGRSESALCQRIGLGGLRLTFGRRGRRCGLGSFQSAPLQAPALSRCYAVVQPYTGHLEMDQGKDDEAGTEEVVQRCRVLHGELWNEDVKLHYVECGDKNGELIVLLHGFPNFWYVWKNQFQALAGAGYHVVAPDLRGYNSSSKPKGIQNYSRRLVVSDIVRVIDEFGNGEPATVVGHDWGGLVTWAIAEDFPDKVKKAVFVNMAHASVFAKALRSNVRQIRQSWYFGFFQLPWLPEWLMTYGNFKNLKASFSSTACQPIDIERHVRAFGKAGAAEGGINYYRAAMRGHWAPDSDAARPIRVELPVDLIWGELDGYIRKELAVIPKEIASDSVVKLLHHCSHWPMWDDPEQFNALLLESVSSQRASFGD